MNHGTILNVPYEEKDQAKELGAKWDPYRKKWFIPPGVSKEKFAQWISQEEKPQITPQNSRG